MRLVRRQWLQLWEIPAVRQLLVLRLRSSLPAPPSDNYVNLVFVCAAGFSGWVRAIAELAARLAGVCVILGGVGRATGKTHSGVGVRARIGSVSYLATVAANVVVLSV